MKYEDMTFENLKTWFLTGILFIAAMVGILAGRIIARGYVLSVLWGWFVVPIFHLSPLSMSQAVAVCFLANFFKEYNPATEQDKAKSQWLAQVVYLPLLTLIIGYIIKAFM
jgi:hypothetical protein